jgi:aspartate/tyrosine/aromatic aminotransferase
LREWHPNKAAKVYCPSPTWPFHYPIAEKCGFEWRHYRYYDR